MAGGSLDDVGRGRAGGGMISGINVTPLVDVVLVLLVVLMVASTYIVSQTIKVQLPKASTTDGPADSPIKVTMQADGALFLDQEPATDAQVSKVLAEAIEKNPEQAVVISADAAVTHGRVVEMIDLAKLAGVTQFAINVEVGR